MPFFNVNSRTAFFSLELKYFSIKVPFSSISSSLKDSKTSSLSLLNASDLSVSQCLENSDHYVSPCLENSDLSISQRSDVSSLSSDGGHSVQKSQKFTLAPAAKFQGP